MPNLESSIFRIPELIDNIIDVLSDDRPTLMACSTVCKFWLPRSRYALFGRMKIKIRPTNSEAFFHLLDSPSSTIIPYVHSLHIERDYGGGGEFWFKDVLPRLVVLGASLKSIVLTLANFVTLAKELEPIFWANFQRLSQLRFDRCRFLSFVQFVDVISMCPRLQNLSVVDMSCRDDDSPLLALHNQPHHLKWPALSRIALSGLGKATFLYWLQCAQELPPIAEVVLDNFIVGDIFHIGTFLRALGPSLLCLRLPSLIQAGGFKSPASNLGGFAIIQANHPTDDFCEEVDLGYNTHLQVIELNSIYQHTIRWMLSILSQITSPHMREVTLHFYHINNIQDLEIFDWDAFHSLLQTNPFSSLKTLYIKLDGDGRLKPRKARHFIRGKLHLGNDKGFLCVDDGSEQPSSQ